MSYAGIETDMKKLNVNIVNCFIQNVLDLVLSVSPPTHKVGGLCHLDRLYWLCVFHKYRQLFYTCEFASYLKYLSSRRVSVLEISCGIWFSKTTIWSITSQGISESEDWNWTWISNAFQKLTVSYPTGNGVMGLNAWSLERVHEQ